MGHANTLSAAETSSSAAPAQAGGASSAEAAWVPWLRQKVSTERAAVTIVFVLGALVFFPFLGTLGLWDPWETHYGEVARAMIARDDYVYPYWESAYFFSKPALPLWMIALGLFVTGAESGAPGTALGSWAEWGVRMPFAIAAILALWAVYRVGTMLRDRSTGVVAAFVLASCPQFIFIGKQAMVDMPYVSMTTLGLALFCSAVFDREPDSAPTPTHRWLTVAGMSVAIFPQLILIVRELEQTIAILGAVLGMVVGAAYVLFVAKWASRRDAYLLGFYTCMALAALAKGLAPALVMGPTLILYMLFSWDWRLLVRSKLVLGMPLFLLVGGPWYLTLSLFKGRDDEGLTFSERFWMHDNFNRLGAGVHGDRGGVGYFMEQLAYGMFPWIALVPFAVGHAAQQARLGAEAPEIAADQAEIQRRRLFLFVLVWGVWSYVAFTIGQTKFHHYIFPAVPPLAVLSAVWFMWLAESPETRLRRAVAFVVLALFAVAARDLINDPQNLVNLFTYKYDRDYPREVVARPFMGVIVGVGGAAMLFFFLVKESKGKALAAFMLTAVVFGAWISHHHFNHLSPHWSQGHLFKTYYDEKKDGEPIYAYQLNWRGETFYSRNTIQQIKEKGANERMRELVDRPGREFIITEQSRFQTLKGVLSPDKRDKLEIIDRSSNKFYLCVVGD